ncbi:response regulator transcription factor [Exilibacterium tricleocarpae]|uniref:Response regulator transcription factor n=1 Tax=Exilibacterium tricleocarpae TaxID=2591008 RepID=A0A545U9H4_9GAMM|nr:response regulator transcription factor [Exilibacterium tricleocarpae]TQV86063.1 response regulator transcription factor [Exilibacterium tricleocarpae]
MMAKKYLIVDDDEMILNRLSLFFEKHGIESSIASNAAEAKDLIEKNSFDLVTVDIILPGESGIELTKWIKSTKGLPVVLLTSLDDSIDVVCGLEIGADDYISKPFDPRVLLARTNAVLRRYQEIGGQDMQQKNIFDTNKRLLKLEGIEYSLSSTEFDFVNILLSEKGKAVSREALYRKMFDKDWHPEDRAIDNIVTRLRKRIEESPQAPKYVVTVRNKGYLIPEGAINTVRG